MKAAKYCDEVVKLDPSNPKGVYRCAIIRANISDDIEALACVSEARAKFPNDTDMAVLEGRVREILRARRKRETKVCDIRRHLLTFVRYGEVFSREATICHPNRFLRYHIRPGARSSTYVVKGAHAKKLVNSYITKCNSKWVLDPQKFRLSSGMGAPRPAIS